MTADRRQITLLSCDMVGSTHYASNLDPEDLETLMAAYFDTCKRVVTEHRGTLAHHTGDGFLAYFGFPRTLGRNAQEAIECGLALVDSMSELRVPGGEQIQVRVGVATGLVVLNDIHRLNNASETFAVGGAIHLAARIQSLADQGKVYVDETSYHLAKRSFEFIDHGMHELKGFSHRNHIWEVSKIRRVQSRFGERIESAIPFVGRNTELQTLTDSWRQAQHAAGQAVLITGEPGIGKSRMVYEFIERVSPKLRPLQYQCLEDHENAPLHPWINYMRHLAQFGLQEPVAVRRRKVERVFGYALPNNERLHGFVVNLIAQDGATLDAQDDTNPSYKLDLLREALVGRVISLAENEVQIVVVEDIHWTDPTSQVVWSSLVEQAARHRVLLLATCHADKSVPHSLPQMTHLHLDRLDAQQSVALASQIIEPDQFTPSVIANIVQRSDGVPLFVEELSRNVSESTEFPSNGGFLREVTAKPNEPLQKIPDTLQGTLLARLDRLGSCKKVAQIASVVGREFDADVVAALADVSQEALANDLKPLVESGLVRAVSKPSTTTYEFKHGLIRQTAYNSLLRRDAVRLHTELAEIYEQNFPGIRTANPELLAQHLTISGRWLDAASLWLDAGVAAKDMGSTEEALQRLENCLHCLASTDEAVETQSIKMRCQLARGSAINSLHGPVEQSAHDAFLEAAALAEALGDPDAAVDALILLTVVKYNSGAFAGARSVANRLINYGVDHANERACAVGRVGAGMCSFATGDFRDAQAQIEQALSALQSDQQSADGYEGLALSYLALSEHILGDTGKAGRISADAIDLARRRRASELAAALGNSLYLHSMKRDIEQTKTVCAELLQLAEKMGFMMWYHHAEFFRGWAATLEGDAGGFELMEASMMRFENAQELVEQSFFYYLLAESYLANGLYASARENIDRGLDLVDRLGEKFFEVPLLRLQAKCLGDAAQDADEQEIAQLLKRSEQIAVEQGAVRWCAPD